MKRGDGPSTVRYERHTDEAYEQELKSLLFKPSSKSKNRLLASAGSGNHQSFGSHHNGRRTDHIERIVLETDTLPGLALLYNTSVSEIKKLNHIYTEQELHARRTVKVPSRGILINLDDQVIASSSTSSHGVAFGNQVREKFPDPSAHSINFSPTLSFDDPDRNESEINANDLSVYLNTKDNFLQEIREKADVAASNSPILNGSSEDDLLQTQPVRRKGSTLKWWHLLIPCLGFIILFPILLFLFQEHIFEHFTSNRTLDPHSKEPGSPILSSSSTAHSAVQTINGEHSS